MPILGGTKDSEKESKKQFWAMARLKAKKEKSKSSSSSVISKQAVASTEAFLNENETSVQKSCAACMQSCMHCMQ